MNLRLKSFWTFLILEVSLIFYTFFDLIISPNKFLLGNTGDGMKNYYHFLNYIQNKNASFYLNTKTNDPYGESIFYLDNVPLLSFITKWISTYLIPLENKSILIHNWFFISNIFFCFLFSYLLFRKLSINILLAGFAAMIISFSNPLVHRINYHFALSFSSSIAVVYFLLYCFQQHLDNNNTKKCWLYGILISLWIYLSSLIHVYFLALLLIVFGFYILLGLRKKIFYIKYLLMFLLPIAVLGITLKTIQIADPFFDKRPKMGGGYDWEFHNFKLDALYSVKETPVKTFPFFINSGYHYHSESIGYLGGIVLYGSFFVLLLFAFHKIKFRLSNSFLLNMFIIGFFYLAISLGNKIQILGHNGILKDNWISPFFWLSKVSDSITHFRVLARFSWVFYFSIFILIIYFINQIPFKGILNKFIIVFLIIAGCSDLYDWIYHLKKSSVNENPTLLSKNDLKALSKINYTDYKAAYYFPYFQVGTNNLDYTLDDYEPVSRFAYGHTLHSGLPMVNHKASRTPDSIAMHQINSLKYILTDTIRYSGIHDKYLVFVFKDSIPRLNTFKADEFFHNRWNEIIFKAKGKHLSSLDKFEVYEISI